MSDDLLSEILAPLRLRGVYQSRWRVRAPWGVKGREERAAIVHYVLDGSCCVLTDEAIHLYAGDIAIFPHGRAHQIADGPGRSAVDLDRLLPVRSAGESDTVDLGGSGPATSFVCAGLEYDEAAESPLYAALPEVLVLRHETISGEPLLAETLRQIAAETARDEPGGRLVALRAFELVYVLALRAALKSRPEPVLRALRHPQIGRALLAVHARFDELWTLATLAREAGMSRSVFAATFREFVGETPARHLTHRRMQEAARLLVDTDLPQSQIPSRVGYESSVGFHLAFRKWFGTTPGVYRARRRARAAGLPA